MLTALLATGFVGGLALIGWHNRDEQNRKLRRENQNLRGELDRAMKAMSPTRSKPDPQFWGNRSIDRLAEDVGLRIVDDPQPREAHSHATKGKSA